jgi:hypothetical protein
MVFILKAEKVNLFVSSVLFVFWYHSPNLLDTPHICDISRLRVKDVRKVVSARHERVMVCLGSVSTYSLSQHVMDVSGELHVRVDLPAGKAPY